MPESPVFLKPTPVDHNKIATELREAIDNALAYDPSVRTANFQTNNVRSLFNNNSDRDVKTAATNIGAPDPDALVSSLQKIVQVENAQRLIVELEGVPKDAPTDVTTSLRINLAFAVTPLYGNKGFSTQNLNTLFRDLNKKLVGLHDDLRFTPAPAKSRYTGPSLQTPANG